MFSVIGIQFLCIVISFIYVDINNIYVKLTLHYDLANEIIAIWFLAVTLYFVYLKLNIENNRILNYHENNSKKEDKLKEVIQNAKENTPKFLILFANYYKDFISKLTRWV